jgi:hypothetical protein
MSDKYLWNRSGDPDPHVTRLENLLGTLRHRPGALDYTRMPAPPPVRLPFWNLRRGLLAVAAVAIVILATGFWVGSSPRPEPVAHGPWLATSLHGAPTLKSAPLRNASRVAAEEWIETDADSSVRLSAGGVGMVDIGPGTRVRVVRTRSGEHRLALERGSLHAHIWAAPGRFSVETPSVTALDLGCSYRIEVDAAGAGSLRVTLGWVGLDYRGVESLVPHGATCALMPGKGPGTPYFDDAPRALVEALAVIDTGEPGARAAAVEAAIVAARPRDALSLWHLLWRVDRDHAGRIYTRLVEFAPPSPAVTRELVMARDRGTLEAWWNTLGYGNADLFRIWRARPGV